MYSYKDFMTGKIKHTRGKFHKWTRGGVTNEWGAVFLNKSSALFVPEYCLTKETLNRLPDKPVKA